MNHKIRGRLSTFLNLSSYLYIGIRLYQWEVTGYPSGFGLFIGLMGTVGVFFGLKVLSVWVEPPEFHELGPDPVSIKRRLKFLVKPNSVLQEEHALVTSETIELSLGEEVTPDGYQMYGEDLMPGVHVHTEEGQKNVIQARPYEDVREEADLPWDE